MQMVLVKLFVRLCICKAWSSVGEDWKEQYGDKPEVTMLLYLIVTWMFTGWLWATHSPSLGL